MTVAGIGLVTVSLNLTNRDVVASWPREAGIYNHLSDSLLNLMSQSDEARVADLGETLDSGLLDQAGLSEALGSELTPEYWQSKFEGVIYPIYDWAEGTTPEPNVELSFGDKQTALARTLEQEIIAQLAAAPVCSSQPSPNDFDVFSADCLPRGVSPQQAARSFTSQLTQADSPLSKPILTSADVEQDLRDVPRAYEQAKRVQWQVPLVLALLVLAVGFSGKNALHGFRRAGQLLFSVGLLAWGSFYLTQRLTRNFSFPADETQAGADVITNLANPLARTVIASFTTTGLWVSLAVMITGILIWLGGFGWHKLHHGAEARQIAEQTMKQRKEPSLPKPVEPKNQPRRG